jgi:hypothetical protein
MFCPQCGHQQVSNETRFCSRCGLSLGLATDLLTTSSDQLRREKRELTGIGLVMATVLMLMNFIIVFGAVTLPHLANPVFLWIWVGFIISALIVGGCGLANLIRGGFFKRLRERESRLKLLKFEQKHQTLPEESRNASFNARSMLLADSVSVTETTTRELQEIPKPTGETSRK